MIALVDVGLFVIDPEAWRLGRESYDAPIGALAVHDRFLRRYPVKVLWSDAFFAGFPWTQPRCPPPLWDLCVLVTSLHERLLGGGRLVTAEALPPAPETVPVLEPDILADEDYLDDVRAAWLALLGAVIPDERLWADGVSLPTWERPALVGVREMRVTLTVAPPMVRAAAILAGEADWKTFLERFHRPDLSDKRVAVLGGERQFFERARESLEAYGLTDLRRLPPAYEQHRTQQQTKQRLETVELVVVCTNRMKHTDTDQLNAVKGELSCTIVLLDADTDAKIVKAVVDHFRALAEPVS